VIVAPIVATTPLWNLIIAAVFLRGREELNARTIAGTACVIILGTGPSLWEDEQHDQPIFLDSRRRGAYR
jgi:drug/metabolite transporter (DMT)-like permease